MPEDKLAKRPQTSLVPMGTELAAYMEIAKAQIASGILPGHIKTPEQYLAMMLRARDMQLDISTVIDGLIPTVSKDPNRPGTTITKTAGLQRALCYKRVPGFQIMYDEITDTYVKARATRTSFNGEWQKYTATIESAALQGLTQRNPNYRTNPSGMLVADATRELCRLVGPEAVFMGGAPYTTEEMVDHGYKAPKTYRQSESGLIDATNSESIIDATQFEEVDANGGE